MKYEKNLGRGGTPRDSNIIKVRLHRIENFLKNLLLQLNKDVRSYETILSDSLMMARGLFSLREEVTIVETGLVAFWLTLQNKGIQEFNVKNLILTAKNKLGRNISAGRVLKLASKAKNRQGSSGSLERVKEILNKLFLKILRGKLGKKIKEKVNVSQYTSILDKKVAQTIEVLDKNKMAIIGHSRKVISAIIFYILDRLVSHKLRIDPVFSAKEIGDLLGVSQYTILRKYKDFLDLIATYKQSFSKIQKETH